MAFPTTPIRDTFNRADTGPPPSSSWTSAAFGAGEGGLRVISNACATESDGNGSGYWNVQTFGPNCEIHASVTTLPTTNNFPVALLLRVQSPGTVNADGYMLQLTWVSAGDDTLAISRIDNDVATQLGATITQNLTAGDGLGLRAIGSTIEAFYRSGAAGDFASLGTRTDATYAGAGNVAAVLGFPLTDTGVRLDDFGAGTIVSIPPGLITQRTRIVTRRRYR